MTNVSARFSCRTLNICDMYPSDGGIDGIEELSFEGIREIEEVLRNADF